MSDIKKPSLPHIRIFPKQVVWEEVRSIKRIKKIKRIFEI